MAATIFNLAEVYKGQHKWLVPNTIVTMLAGSYAYGTSTLESDVDVRGVCIAPRRYYFGFIDHFKLAEIKGDPDVVIYGLNTFIELAAQTNPNLIELLFTDNADILTCTSWWERILDIRHEFLSREAKQRFGGYARSQLKDAKSHRRWLISPPKAPPTRAEFGLPEYNSAISNDQMQAALQAIQNRIDSWQLDLTGMEMANRIALKGKLEEYMLECGVIGAAEQFERAGAVLGYSSNFLEVVKAERRYRAAKNEWAQYQTWLAERNPKRAEMEHRMGYDGKNISHLVRLMRMAEEIIVDGKVIVKRPDAEELLAIKNGALKWDDIESWADATDRRLTDAIKLSPLPDKPNRVKINEVLMRLVQGFHITTEG